MIDKLFLNTEGYQVSFDLKTLPDRTDAFDTIIHFRLDPRLGNVAFTSFPAHLTCETLQRLVTYLEQHIAQLEDESFKSYVFVPLNLQFQLQALAGGINSPDDGEFGLRFMINMEQPDVDLTSVDVGGEAVVTLEEINHFLASVKHLLANTSH